MQDTLAQIAATIANSASDSLLAYHAIACYGPSDGQNHGHVSYFFERLHP